MLNGTPKLLQLLNDLQKNKPITVAIDPNIKSLMQNDNVLSQELLIFKHSGRIGGKEAVRFVELTPELSAILNYYA